MRWNTAAMVKLLSDSRWDIEVMEPGGDVDTEGLLLRAQGAGKAEHLEGEPDERIFLTISGFKVEGDVTEAGDAEIDMVEVSDGMTSDGGLNTSDPATCRMYAEVVILLRGASFEVVPSMDAYF